jgi:hypothetical protein
LIGYHPRQKLGDLIDRMIGDALDHEAKISFRVDTVELG